MIMEIAVRLASIALAEKNRSAANTSLAIAENQRKALGWNVEKYDQWKDPIWTDTSKLMGITK